MHLARMTMKCCVWAIFTVAVLSVSAFSQQTAPTSAPRQDQGCVNQGSDRREFAPVVCWLQRQLSWKSEHEPHYTEIGRHDGTHLGVAWPPYLVFNSPDGNGNWRVCRVGFRYDRTWRGYIFPAMAAKRITHPLRF